MCCPVGLVWSQLWDVYGKARTGRISSFSHQSVGQKSFKFWIETFRYGAKQWDSVAAVYPGPLLEPRPWWVSGWKVKGAALGTSLTVFCPQDMYVTTRNPSLGY